MRWRRSIIAGSGKRVLFEIVSRALMPWSLGPLGLALLVTAAEDPVLRREGLLPAAAAFQVPQQRGSDRHHAPRSTISQTQLPVCIPAHGAPKTAKNISKRTLLFSNSDATIFDKINGNVHDNSPHN